MTAPPAVAVITGPTATGKTALGVLLAESLNGEVISADSMQIYRRMDIGTAKPDPAELRGVTHHMIDVAEPGEDWSVARWTEEAAKCADHILARGKLPIIVGGTGLYIDSLVQGRDFADVPGDEALREELSGEYDELGGEAMLERLRAVDPQRAAKLPAGDKRRVLRALEVFLVTGMTITEHDALTRARPPRYDAAVVALTFRDRARLYSRIDRRVDDMAAAGLFDEVRALLASGVPESCTAMQAIGYKEAVAALQGRCTQAEALEAIKLASRRYAKRQLTWLRPREGLRWILWDDAPDFDFARRVSTEFFSSRGIK